MHIRLRPGELYLRPWSVQGQLQLSVFYDKYIFSGDVVDKQLCEFREAVR